MANHLVITAYFRTQYLCGIVNISSNYNSDFRLNGIVDGELPIVPLPNGNGRIGRLITLKECLRFGPIPLIIEDAKKAYYYWKLSEWEKGYLV